MKPIIYALLLAGAVSCGTTADDTNNGTNNATSGTTNNATNGTTNNATNGTTNNATNGTTNNATNGTTNNATNGSTNNGTNNTNNAVGGWVPASSACAGSKTNALWFDDRNNGFAGCGEGADGYGFFKTVDGGMTWTEVFDFESLRINDIIRVDGTLYLAGIRNPGGGSAFKVADDNGTLSYTVMFTPSNNAFNSVSQAENIAVQADGSVLVDSLTGASATLVAANGDVTETSTLHEDAIADPDTTSSFQVRRVRPAATGFMGVGSTINQPAQFMAPSALAGATFHMHPVELQESFESGELLDFWSWGAQKMLLVGWNQTTNANRSPLMFRLDGTDSTVAANWKEVNLRAQGIEFEGGAYALAVNGDKTVVVGTKFPSSQGGFVLHSVDAGTTWTDMTPGPDKPGELSNAWYFANGDIYVAGGGKKGFIYHAN